jgi:hypothetical protein
MWKLKGDIRMNVNLMVSKRKLAYSLSTKNKHMKQSGTQIGLGK